MLTSLHCRPISLCSMTSTVPLFRTPSPQIACMHELASSLFLPSCCEPQLPNLSQLWRSSFLIVRRRFCTGCGSVRVCADIAHFSSHTVMRCAVLCCLLLHHPMTVASPAYSSCICRNVERGGTHTCSRSACPSSAPAGPRCRCCAVQPCPCTNHSNW
jgi:hypothetical protein